ncbi:MAG: hypothetical protein IMZ55_15465 [Acidobacteria bacterium]|nr:hypothetical protein [Acidobacteriota bacterium]
MSDEPTRGEIRDAFVKAAALMEEVRGLVEDLRGILAELRKLFPAKP